MKFLALLFPYTRSLLRQRDMLAKSNNDILDRSITAAGECAAIVEGLKQRLGTSEHEHLHTHERLNQMLADRDAWKAKAEALQDNGEKWYKEAARIQGNADYYRELVTKCGEAIGGDAYIADDGLKSEDVLCAKVPELVEKLVNNAHRLDYELQATMGSRKGLALQLKEREDQLAAAMRTTPGGISKEHSALRDAKGFIEQWLGIDKDVTISELLDELAKQLEIGPWDEDKCTCRGDNGPCRYCEDGQFHPIP